jgi:RNA polymerase sigma-70 factor (ECF subfamily)
MADEMTTRMPESVRLRALMASYQAGHIEAFDELYALVAPAVRRYLLSLARDVTRADDLLQETFLQIHRARHTFDPAYPLMPWALAIARHCWLMDRRAARRRPTVALDIDAHAPLIRPEPEGWVDRMDVREAVSALPSARRHAVVAHHVMGFSFKEIAGRLGVAEAAAKLRSSRGIRQLRTLLQRKPPS